MTMRRAFTVLETCIVAAIVTLMVSIMIPSLQRARELSRQMAAESGQTAADAVETETEEMAAAREAAQEMADDLDIDGRIERILAEHGAASLRATVFTDLPEGSGPTPGAARRNVLLQQSHDGVSVTIDGVAVYLSEGGEVRKYLGAGEWEDALDRVLWQVRDANASRERREREEREAAFRQERLRRYAPLPGFGG